MPRPLDSEESSRGKQSSCAAVLSAKLRPVSYDRDAIGSEIPPIKQCCRVREDQLPGFFGRKGAPRKESLSGPYDLRTLTEHGEHHFGLELASLNNARSQQLAKRGRGPVPRDGVFARGGLEPWVSL